MEIQNDKTNSIVRIGFGAIILMIIGLMAAGLYQYRTIVDQLHHVVDIDNQKIELASNMRELIRLRQISMNSMLVMDNEKHLENEIAKFGLLAAAYLENRNELIKLPMSDDEQIAHDKIRAEILLAYPINSEAADAMLMGDALKETVPLVQLAQVGQQNMLVLLDELIKLQQKDTKERTRNSITTYKNSLVFTLICGLVLIFVTLSAAYFISKYVSKRNHILLDAVKKADDATNAKSKFLAQMSHELRTPMNAILGFSELIHNDENLTREQKKFVGDILKAGNHLLQLINQVLDLAGIESNKVDISMESVPLCDVLQDCRKLSIQMAETKNVTLYMGDMTCKDKLVHADKLRLKQVMLNLVSNAIKYNNEGGLVTVQCELTDNDRYRISITDTGPGIPKHKIKDLFQPFNRLGSENSKIEGTGIGLVITKNLVEIMGGSIGVHSAEAGGSVFWIELRRGQPIPNKLSEPEQEEKMCTEELVNHSQESAVDTKTLLYVEDNTENTKVMKHYINKIGGYRLINAVTAERGLLMAKSYNPDLILMDINLPGMDGFAALSELQELSETKNVPVVAVSANVMPGEIKKAMDAGFKDYITKPIDFKKLKIALDYYCQTSGPTSASPSLEIVGNQD